MADTTYIDFVQPAVSAEWLNEINDHVWHDDPVVGTTVHAASAIAITPFDDIAATDVQAALNEINDKIPPSDPIDASDVSYTSGGTGAVVTTVETRLRQTISIKDFGAVGDGVTDDSAAVALARTAANTVGAFVHFPAGTYKLNSAITSSEDLKFVGEGDATVLDFTGTITGGNYALEAIGTATQIEELSGSQTIGLNTVLFTSAPSLVVGDVFVIFNPTNSSWSGFRTNYFAGEWCEVESISGNTVTTKNPLYATYAAANVDIYKITGPDVVLRDIKIIGTTVLGLITTTFCLHPLLENVTTEHANDSAIYIDRCFRPTINNPNVRNVGDGGDDYGIVIGNSQHSRINGGTIYSRRHAVTHGGGAGVCSVPVRDSRIIGSLLRNDIASGTESADFHGNTEDSSYINCAIYGGANLQGKDNEYVNCRITNDLNGVVMYHGEVIGGRLGARNCRFITYINPQPGSRGVYDIGGNSNAVTANTVLPTTFFVKDCSVYGRNLTGLTSFMLVRNAGTAAKLNFDIDGLTADVNLLGSILRTSMDSGTAASDFIVVDNVKNFPAGSVLHFPAAGSYLPFPHRMQKQTGKQTLVATSGTASTLGATTTFRYEYPRAPDAHATSVGSVNSNRMAYGSIHTLTATTIRPMIESGDETNWGATANRDVSWTVSIDEV